MKTTARAVWGILTVLLCVGLSSGDQQGLAATPQTKLLRISGTTVTLELVRTPPGEVELDGDRTAVPALWVGRTEIPWELYDVYLYGLDEPAQESGGAPDAVSRPSKPYVPPDRGFGHTGFAAIGMTRHAAEQFCAWLTERARGDAGGRFRLPTEAEWVYLAAAGGPGGAPTAEHAWFEENSDWTPHPVGEKAPNAFGLHDMLGNVAEWVASDENPPFAMGGSYLEPAEECTPRSRLTQNSMWNSSDPQIPKSRWWLADCGFVGFRVVREAAARAEPEENGTE